MFGSSLRRAAQIRGGAVALVCGDRAYTWRQLADRVARLASVLRHRGVQPGDRVVLLISNSDRCFELFHAVLWAGAVLAPLNTRMAVSEATDCVEDCEAALIVTDETHLPLAQAVAAATGTPLLVSNEDVRGVCEIEAALAEASPMDEHSRRDDDLAALFYTGGTTGRSKGVMLSQGNLASNALANLGEGLFAEHSIYLHASPTFHIAGAMGVFNQVVSAGSSVMLPRFDPGEVLGHVERFGIGETLLVPTMIQMVLDHPRIASTDLSTLRRILYGASPISEATLDRALAAMPGVELVQLYGMTELSPVCTVLHHCELSGEGRRKNRHRSAGRPTIGVEVTVFDERGVPAATGEVGEIVVRGGVVMMGYWRRENETADALAGGWMHTGDGGYRDEDGFIYVCDRIKDMIITGGENVYSVEVENVLAKHPAVKQCAVVGAPDDGWGERVHAVVLLHDGQVVTEAELDQWCREALAGFKVPRSFDFRTQPLPISAAGKILKRDLRQALAAGAGPA